MAPFFEAMSSATTRRRFRPLRVRGREVERTVKARFSSGREREIGVRPESSGGRAGDVVEEEEEGGWEEVKNSVPPPSTVSPPKKSREELTTLLILLGK
jgi:hypothetical protein